MGQKALVVDDSKTMRDMVAFTLKSAGFDVCEAGDGKEALSALSKYPADVIITDLNMPNMNGFEFIRAMREIGAFKFTPVLMLTTEGDSAKKQEGKSAGATGWIVKPFSPDKLVQVVKKVCGE